MRIEYKKKAFLDEQATKEEQLRLLELERQALLEIERKKVSKRNYIDSFLNNLMVNLKTCVSMVETTLLHPPLLRLYKVEDIQELLHDLLALAEERLQNMIIIGDKHLLGTQDNLHNMLTMFHSMGVVA